MQVVNIDALQRDYDRRANEAAALLASTAKTCQAHEEKDADGKVIAQGRLMSAEDARVVPAVASQAEAIARAIEVIAKRLRSGGRLVYVGAGTSGRLGVLDATECPPTFNAPPGVVVGLIAGGPPALFHVCTALSR